MSVKSNKSKSDAKKDQSKKIHQPITDDLGTKIVSENLPVLDSGTSSNTNNLMFSNQNSFNKIKKFPIMNKIRLNANQIFALLALVITIGGTIWISFGLIPYVTDQTDEAKAAREKKDSDAKAAKDKQDKQDKLAAESKALNLSEKTDFSLNMKIKIADQDDKDIKIKLNKNWAPQTVENFVRLAYRGYYNNMLFHRLVEEPNFAVIQGGDPTGNGNGGETASGDPLPDELWTVKPDISQSSDGQSSTITNDPVFREPSLYTDFDKTTGNVTYRKGLILMAKTQSPDSATSQFFITLDKTVLPAQYTVFATVDDKSLDVLDYITKEVDPVANETNPDLTKPSKDVKIVKIDIL